MLEGIKNFKSLIGISALLVAGCAAFFSVYGLSKLFSGAALSVVIMAGGKGIRLKPFTEVLPKPLIPIGNKTALEHIIDNFFSIPPP